MTTQREVETETNSSEYENILLELHECFYNPSRRWPTAAKIQMAIPLLVSLTELSGTVKSVKIKADVSHFPSATEYWLKNRTERCLRRSRMYSKYLQKQCIICKNRGKIK